MAQDAAEIVKAYLSAMEARDLAGASEFLARDFAMTFPGGARFRTPEELVDWARSRYRRVGKTYETVEAFRAGADEIVYCIGTLHGEWPDGSPFSNIRFIDRFTVRDGTIIDQQVWNDLAEVRHAAGTD